MKTATQLAPATTAKKVAIYTRKSVARGLEMEFNSLDAQYEACAAYIKAQPGWSLIPTRYDDGGFTGANMDRPAFQRLLDDVEARRIDVIVVYKVDRLSRSLLDFAAFMQRLSDVDASFVSITQAFNTCDSMGRLTLNLLLSFAQFEREMIADRTRDKIRAARRRGIWGVGSVPFGYDRRDRKLVPNEADALTVRTAFELLLEHQQPVVVARTLNQRGLFPRGKKLPLGKQRKWNGDSISRVLRNVTFTGKLMAGDEVCQGEHAPLVDQDIFDRAQTILADAAPHRTAHGRNAEYILRGLLRCGQCGAAMSPASTRHDGEEFRYYVCSRRAKTGSDDCRAKSLPAGAIEQYVVERIGEAASDASFVSATTAALARRIRDRQDAVDVLCRTLPTTIATISATTSKLTDELLRAEGPIRTAVETKLRVESEHLAEAERQLAQAQRDRTDLAQLTADATWVANTLADFAKVWDVLTLPNRARLLHALVEHITVDEPSGKVEIHLVDFAPPAAADATREAA